jgi:hypothetical protein
MLDERKCRPMLFTSTLVVANLLLFWLGLIGRVQYNGATYRNPWGGPIGAAGVPASVFGGILASFGVFYAYSVIAGEPDRTLNTAATGLAVACIITSGAYIAILRRHDARRGIYLRSKRTGGTWRTSRGRHAGGFVDHTRSPDRRDYVPAVLGIVGPSLLMLAMYLL